MTNTLALAHLMPFSSNCARPTPRRMGQVLANKPQAQRPVQPAQTQPAPAQPMQAQPVQVQPAHAQAPAPAQPFHFIDDLVLRGDDSGAQSASFVELRRVATLPNGAALVSALHDAALRADRAALHAGRGMLANALLTVGQPPPFAEAFALMGARAATVEATFAHLGALEFHLSQPQVDFDAATQAANGAEASAIVGNIQQVLTRHQIFQSFTNRAPAPLSYSYTPSLSPENAALTPAAVTPEEIFPATPPQHQSFEAALLADGAPFHWDAFNDTMDKLLMDVSSVENFDALFSQHEAPHRALTPRAAVAPANLFENAELFSQAAAPAAAKKATSKRSKKATPKDAVKGARVLKGSTVDTRTFKSSTRAYRPIRPAPAR